MAERGINREKTALTRTSLSYPMRLLLTHGFLEGSHSVFDYGCGKGDDVRCLGEIGVAATGWDPAYFPDTSLSSADIVNLGYVLNVIEDPAERVDVCREAYELAGKVLVVSVMLGYERKRAQFASWGDGVVTERKTFQKYFTQDEFRSLVEDVLGVTPIALAPGVCLVFRDEVAEQSFLLARNEVRRRWRLLEAPTEEMLGEIRSIADENRQLINLLRELQLELGRHPHQEEFPAQADITRLFGSWARCQRAIDQLFDAEEAQNAARSRREDLLVYLALLQFGKRRAYKHMPDRLRRDIRHFFGNIRSAYEEARTLLFSVGDTSVIVDASRIAFDQGIGWLQGDHDLQFHRSQLGACPPVLRVYVGCGLKLFGDVEAVDLIKVHLWSGKVSFQIYDDLEEAPIPLLRERIKVSLRTQTVEFFDYYGPYEPQPLFWKSRYVPDAFAHYVEQEAFDAQLGELGIVVDDDGFGPGLAELNERLNAAGVVIDGFELSTTR